MRPHNTAQGPVDESIKFRPRYLSMPCPEKYRYICGFCSKRYGEPDRLGWIDVTRCPDCDAKKQEN